MDLRSNIVVIDLHDYDRIKNELKYLRLSLQVSEDKNKLMNELVKLLKDEIEKSKENEYE